ncbi:hypothetical protein L596_028430 [Steinernema carpocapsae]|uniref:Uncharacterized protein n=1 Tax=Steinernema carpocapsae TaxID=34508 RepID=A0A4U5LYF5_STECR|nr:hypothetical protein L596_028430 [Steinernema carpocapsae]
MIARSKKAVEGGPRKRVIRMAFVPLFRSLAKTPLNLRKFGFPRAKFGNRRLNKQTSNGFRAMKRLKRSLRPRTTPARFIQTCVTSNVIICSISPLENNVISPNGHSPVVLCLITEVSKQI